jgi:hypothetical protein
LGLADLQRRLRHALQSGQHQYRQQRIQRPNTRPPALLLGKGPVVVRLDILKRLDDFWMCENRGVGCPTAGADCAGTSFDSDAIASRKAQITDR